jgi:hypothetical protein
LTISNADSGSFPSNALCAGSHIAHTRWRIISHQVMHSHYIDGMHLPYLYALFPRSALLLEAISRSSPVHRENQVAQGSSIHSKPNCGCAGKFWKRKSLPGFYKYRKMVFDLFMVLSL